MTDSLSPADKKRDAAVVHPQGHGLYHWIEGRYVRRLVPVREDLTFVDAANSADPAQDGTAEHPWASIRTAAAKAGENAVIFVRSGVYREAIALSPGQTLAGAVELAGPLAGQVYAEERPPLIEPETLLECPVPDDDTPGVAALVLSPGASARGLEIAARRSEDAEKPDRAVAVLVYADRDAAHDAAAVRDCVIRAEGKNILGVALAALGQKATLRGELTGNRIRTEGADADGVFVVARDGGQTRNCVIRENDIATAGSWAWGISVKIFGGGIHDALVLRGNTVATTGKYAYGLRADVCDRYDTEKKKQIRGLEVRDNTVHCKGQGASGIILVGHTEHGYAWGESVLEACTVVGNAVTTEGRGADGVYAGSHEGVLIKNFTVQENTIVTAGANAAGIHTEDYGMQSGLKLRGNVIIVNVVEYFRIEFS